MTLDGLHVVHGAKASGGRLVATTSTDEVTLKTDFGGPSGLYDLTLYAQDECDGQSVVEILVDGVPAGTITLDRDDQGVGSDHGGFQAFTLRGVALPEGAEITLQSVRDGGERLRLDKLALHRTGDLPADDACADEVTLAHEDFDRVHRPKDASIIKSDDCWEVRHDALYTDGRNDGALVLEALEIDGHDAVTVSFDVRTDDIRPFEHADSLTLQVRTDGGHWVTLDQFRRGSGDRRDVFVGSETGKTFGETETGLSYEVDAAGAGAVQFRFVSDISWHDEIIRIDDLRIEATKACPPPGDCEIVTEVIGHEDFDDVHDPDDSALIESDAKWEVRRDALFTNGSNDGELELAALDVTGKDSVDLGFEAKVENIHRFEHADVLFVQVRLDGGVWRTLDEFRRDGNVLRGKETGQVIDGDGEALSWSVDADGAASAQFRLVSRISANNEKIRIDDLKVEAHETVCDPEPALGALGDFVWLDADRDGRQDAGEGGVEGVTATLFTAGDDGVFGTSDDVAEATDVTDADGAYLFEGLEAGDYQVRFAGAPAGLSFTQQNVGGGAGDSDVDAAGVSDVVTLGAGETDLTVDAGLVALPASLGDRVWFDADADGVQDFDEAGVDGVKVTLSGAGADGRLGTADDTAATTTTARGGFYRFDDLNAGEQYQVRFSDLPETLRLTAQDAGDDAFDSDADPATGRTGVVTLDPGEFDRSVDAGLIEKPDCGPGFTKITFADLSAGDGVFDQFLAEFGLTVTAVRDGETGPASAMVFDTYNPTGGDDDLATIGQGNVLIISEDDDASDPDDNASGGTIRFDFLNGAAVGDLTVIDIETPGGVIELFDLNGALIRSIDIAVNGDGGVSTLMVGEAEVGAMEVTFASSGAIDDICIAPGDGGGNVLARLGDVVWFDADGDGLQGADEDGVEGVTVALIGGGPDGIVGFGDDEVLGTATTDADGVYVFEGLAPDAEYLVEFTLPAGFAFTTQNVDADVSDAADSDADPVTGRSQVVTLTTDAPEDLTLDAGLVIPAPVFGTIEGRIFCDKNGNGLDDDSMPGMDSGIGPRFVRLFDGAGAQVAETLTDATGAYRFDGLVDGDYTVEFDVQQFTTQNVDGDVSDAIDSDADAATGRSGTVTVADAGTVSDVDAGVLCLPVPDTGLLNVLGFAEMPFLEIGNGGELTYDHSPSTASGDLIVHGNINDQFGFTPMLPTDPGQLRTAFGATLDAADGNVLDGGEATDFFVWLDEDLDKEIDADETVFLEGSVIRMGSQNTDPAPGQGVSTDTHEFVVNLTGGEAFEQFNGLMGIQITSERSDFDGSFEESFGGEAKGFIAALSYDCIC